MWQHKCHFIEDSNVPSTITTTPSISTIEGGSVAQDGAARAMELQQPIHELGPLPHPLPLEPWEELQLEEEQEGFYPPDMEEQEIQDEELIVHPVPIPEPQAVLPVPDADATVRRSNRTKRPSRCLQEHLELHMIQVMETTLMEDDPVTGVHPILAMAMSNDPDILTLREAMSADDSDEFRKSMIQEFNDHCDRTHWVFVLRSSLPHGTKVLPSVWAMRRKQRIATGQVYK